MTSINIVSYKKKIEIFGRKRNAPLIIYHAFAGEGKDLNTKLEQCVLAPYTLAVVNDIAWDDEMTPWAIPPISAQDTPCGGRADTYIEHLQNEILPDILSELVDKPACLAIAGYSLGGLFALYAGYRTNLFTEIASASGSFWYPGFREYVTLNAISETTKKIYLSLGDKEAKTKNPYLQPVAKNTEWLAEWYTKKNITTKFEWNKGNHFADATGRMAKAINYILQK